MKRLFTVFTFLCMMTLPGCSWFQNLGCTVQNAASGAIASTLTHTLSCANGTQVLADVTALVSKTNICSLTPPTPPQAGQKTGPIAMLICPALSQLAATELGTAVPASWQCDPTLAKEGLALALTSACNLLPF